MSLTEPQARAAHADGSVAVVAGAGSGKTHMLVARYLHHLDAHGLSPLQIVAVTFTEKAAAELRARVRRDVTRARPDDFDTLAELEAAQIGTIHGLCTRIIRDHPEAAGVRPDARVLDERDAALWLAQNYADALTSLPARVFARLPYSRMSGMLASLLQDPIEAQRAFDVGTGSWEAWAAETRARAVQRLVGLDVWREAVRTLKAFCGAEGDRIELARREALLHATRFTDDPEAHAHGLVGVKLTGGSAKSWPGGGFNEVKEAVKVLRSQVETARQDGLTLAVGVSDTWLEGVLPDLRDAFTHARAHLAERKRREGVMDFADLEVHALHALRDPEVRAHYARRWQAFLIDEFQDTNSVQDEILRLLRGERLTTIVGDEKQSIYGFRRADVELFRRARHDLRAAGGTEVELDLSFRTHAALVERCNAIFAPLLGDLHAPLKAARPALHGAPVEAYVIDAPGTSAQLKRAEGVLIARRVRALLDEGLPVQGEEGTRSAQPRDVAVLSRTWASLAQYGAALVAAGVPVVEAGGGSLLSTPEALDVLNLLTAVAVEDPLSVVGVLRSPWCAVSDRTLQELNEERGERSWLDVLGDSPDPVARRAHRVLAALVAERRTLAPSRLVQLADRLTGYSAVIANLWGAERRLADWRGMLDFVRTLERGEDDVFLVVRRLRELVNADLHVPRPVVAGANAVTLSTVHGAKGLEWPVVVAADLAWTPPTDSSPLLFSARYGVACRVDEDEAEPPVAFAVMRTERSRREEAEARRLLYVALTRARDHLILTSSARGARTALALLEPGLEAAGVELVGVVPEDGDEEIAALGALPLPDVPDEVWMDASPEVGT